MARGTLSDKVKARAVELMGREISIRELRFLPYVQYVMMNEQKIDPNKVSAEERDILSKWREAKYIEGGASGLAITREFWDIISDLCFIAYVEQAD